MDWATEILRHPDRVTLSAQALATIERKRSYFHALALPIVDEQAAEQGLASRRQLYPSARHHVYAWRSGVISPPYLQRSSDDGEPSGTGGAVLMQILERRQLEDCLLVVSRIFGGVLLGTGGLARAYGDAALAALEQAGEARLRWSLPLRVTLSYNDYASLEYKLQKKQVHIEQRHFSEMVDLDLILPLQDEQAPAQWLLEALGDWGSGRFQLATGQLFWWHQVK